MARICFFNSTKFWGGGEKWHLQAAVSMKSCGHEVWIIANLESEIKKRAEAEQIQVFSLNVGNLSFTNVFKIQKLSAFLKKNKIDSIIMNGSADLKLGAIAATQAGLKQLIYRRGSPTAIKKSFINKKVLTEYITHIIVNSSHTYQESFKNYSSQIPSEKVSVIYNGIETKLFGKQKNEPNKPLRICNVGRLSEEKGQMGLIKLASELNKKKLDFAIHLAGEGDLRKALESGIIENALQKNVILDGFVADIPNYLKNKDILVVSSHWEGFGFVIIEAMASGLPVISVDIPVAHELIEQGETGFVVNNRNWEEMAEKISLLSENGDLYQKISTNCQKHAKLFEQKLQMDKLEQVILAGW
ncbi:MAG: glycosyltransferase involved in cell wall biosynthesis [Arenicella sp.]|jgi:glycosyltransferase involved in cell wall biosynthesis